MVALKKVFLTKNKKHRNRKFSHLYKKFQNKMRLVPNLFSLGNVFLGFCSITFAATGNFTSAAYFILFGALMDMFDGKIARFTGNTSEIGMQLDSLSDAISFCLAPALLIYLWRLKDIDPIGFLGCALFLIAGVFRLAKFNVSSAEQALFFLGIPTTIAGCFLATILLNTDSAIPPNWGTLCLLVIVVTLALLMLSDIRFPTFKQGNKRWHKRAFFIMVISFIVVMDWVKALLALLIFYIVLGFEKTACIKYNRYKQKKRIRFDE